MTTKDHKKEGSSTEDTSPGVELAAVAKKHRRCTARFEIMGRLGLEQVSCELEPDHAANHEGKHANGAVRWPSSSSLKT
jgi:hypothetical protein